MTDITPEGPAATRCERCARELHTDTYAPTGDACWGDDDLDCYRVGYAKLSARLVEVERETTASRACIEFDPPSEPAQIVARLRLIVENHNKQCGDFVTQRNSAWQRAIEIGKAKKAAESRASAAEGALRAARGVLDPDRPNDSFTETACEILDLALSGLPPLTSASGMAQPTPAALVPKEEA